MHPFEVRTATPDDLDDLVSLCLTARAEASVGPQVCSPQRDVLAHQLGTLAAAPGGVLLVARRDEVAVGLLVARVVGPNPFTDDVSLTVEAVYVLPAERRRGVGRRLMLVATDVAAQGGAGHVYASPVPGARGMHRFLVQLGFAPAASYRVSTTSALQRRLVGEPAGRRAAGRGLEDLIARRRRSRLADGGAHAGPTAAGGPGDGQEGRSPMSMHVSRAVQTRRDASSTTTIS